MPSVGFLPSAKGEGWEHLAAASDPKGCRRLCPAQLVLSLLCPGQPSIPIILLALPLQLWGGPGGCLDFPVLHRQPLR